MFSLFIAHSPGELPFHLPFPLYLLSMLPEFYPYADSPVHTFPPTPILPHVLYLHLPSSLPNLHHPYFSLPISIFTCPHTFPPVPIFPYSSLYLSSPLLNLYHASSVYPLAASPVQLPIHLLPSLTLLRIPSSLPNLYHAS